MLSTKTVMKKLVNAIFSHDERSDVENMNALIVEIMGFATCAEQASEQASVEETAA